MNIYDDNEIDLSFVILIFFLFGHIFLIHGIYHGYIIDNQDWEEREDNTKTMSDVETSQEEEVKKTQEILYEEKYLIKIRSMKNEYVFTDEELKLQEKKLKEFEEEENKKKLESIYVLNEKIEELAMKLTEFNVENIDNQNNESLMKKLYVSIQNEIDLNKKKLIEIQDESSNKDELNEKAQQYIIDEQLKEFKKRYIIEHTPIGNVLMFYNHDKLAFEYYSDLTIPYRYLETVARKYVTTYNYRPLYIDMEEELKEYEKKLEEKEKEKEKQIELQEISRRENSESSSNVAKPKDVFAKFKSYNKEAGTGRVNTAPPPKNSIPQNRMVGAHTVNSVNTINNAKKGKNSEKMLLKERANRYSYQGKFLNFNILQKIDKKVVDKKYALTFAEFKKMNKLENKN